MKIIGVTKCPNGLAHTYMSAEKLESVGKELGYEIKIETQGAGVVENQLNESDIETADFVIIAADAVIDGKERFIGKKILETPIAPVLQNTEKIFFELPQQAVEFKCSDEKSQQETNREERHVSFGPSLLNGFTHLLPFLVIGGLCISWFPYITQHLFISEQLNFIIIQVFRLISPVLAGFIAYSITGRASLAPAMISSQIFESSIDGENNVLGIILVGFFAGYLTKYLSSCKLPKSIYPILPIVVIPILATFITVGVFAFLSGYLNLIFEWFVLILTICQTNVVLSLLFGAILGIILSIDIGGKINKVGYILGVISLLTHDFQVMGVVACIIGVPSLACYFASFWSKDIPNDIRYGKKREALFSGLLGISEGAIPYLDKNRKVLLYSIVCGSAVTGAVSMLLKVTISIPNGGPVAGLLGASNNVLLYLLTILIGIIAVNAFLILFGKLFNKGVQN